MIYKKRPAEIVGLWCRQNKTFYYLESGLHSIRNPLDRLRNSLTVQGLVPFTSENVRLHEEPLIKMTMAQAQEHDYKIGTIYLNPHIQQQVEAEQAGKTIGGRANPWVKPREE